MAEKGKRRFHRIRHPKKVAFLEVYAITGNVSEAARRAGIDRTTFYDWVERDPKFKEAVEIAEQEATELLEREAFRRAVSGVKEPIFHQGQRVGQVRRYSDTLLIFLLKARAPEKYREKFDVESRVQKTLRIVVDGGGDGDSDPDRADPDAGMEGPAETA